MSYYLRPYNLGAVAVTPGDQMTAALNNANAKIAARLTSRGKAKLGSQPINKMVQIYAPQMAFLQDVVNYAIDFMGPLARTVGMGLSNIEKMRPKQSSDSRLPSSTASLVQSLRTIAAFTVLWDAPAGVGHTPLAYGLAKALTKRGKWSQAKLDQVASRLVRIAQSLPRPPGVPAFPTPPGISLAPPPAPPPPPPPPPAPPKPPRLFGLGALGADDLTDAAATTDAETATHDAGVGEQADTSKEMAQSDSYKEIADLVLEFMRIGGPLALGVTQAVVASGGPLPTRLQPVQMQPPPEVSPPPAATAQSAGGGSGMVVAAVGVIAALLVVPKLLKKG